MIYSDLEQFPVFLQSYGKLKDHLDSQLQDLTSKRKGDIFVDFVTKIIPLTDLGIQYQLEDIVKRQHSYDEGVDLECRNLSGTNY